MKLQTTKADSIPEYGSDRLISGLLRGFQLEFSKGAESRLSDVIYTNNVDDTANPDFENEIRKAGRNGFTPTGHAVFNGYFKKTQDLDFGTEVIRLASKDEVEQQIKANEEEYTKRVEATITAARIVDIFDDFLEEKGITIPSSIKEMMEDDALEGNSAVLYGTDFAELESAVASILLE